MFSVDSVRCSELQCLVLIVFDVVMFRVAVFSVDSVQCCSVRWVQVAARSPTDVSCLRHILLFYTYRPAPQLKKKGNRV